MRKLFALTAAVSSLTTASAFSAVFSGLQSESFDTAATATANGWVSSGTTPNGSNFDFGNHPRLTAQNGMGGGRVYQDSTSPPNYYADTDLGATYTSSQDLVAYFAVYMPASQSDAGNTATGSSPGTTLIGFFNKSNPNQFIGAVVQRQGSTQNKLIANPAIGAHGTAGSGGASGIFTTKSGSTFTNLVTGNTYVSGNQVDVIGRSSTQLGNLVGYADGTANLGSQTSNVDTAIYIRLDYFALNGKSYVSVFQGAGAALAAATLDHNTAAMTAGSASATAGSNSDGSYVWNVANKAFNDSDVGGRASGGTAANNNMTGFTYDSFGLLRPDTNIISSGATNTNYFADVYIDNASYGLVPEPTSIAAVGLGSLLLRRRRA